MSNAVRKIEPPFMSLLEFLDWPGDGSAKHYELFDGHVRAMAPASPAHALIQTRLGYLVTRRLIESGSRCQALTEAGVVPRLRESSHP